MAHRIVGALVVLGLLVGVACAPAAAPTPIAAPAKAAEPTASAPKPATTPAAKAEAPSSQPAASGDWKAEWDKTVAAAKKEGKVTVAIPRGATYRESFMAFRKSYPDIQLEAEAVEGGDFAPKVLAEREGGQYLWDVYIGGATSGLTIMRPRGVFDSLRPALLLPEILDSSKWVGGLDDPWQDRERQYIFGFEGRLFFIAYVDRDFVPESELNSIDQLLDPKWKGKIAAGDPRGAGTANGAGGHLLSVKGEDWLRKLYSQDLVIMQDERLLADAVVRGRYHVVVGINPGAALDEYKAAGVGKNLKPLAPESQDGASLSSGRGNLSLINKAPHPNAAKVYINWVLSREGMKAYVDATKFTTRRVDLESPEEYRPRPNVEYRDLNKDAMVPFKSRVMEIAKEMFK